MGWGARGAWRAWCGAGPALVAVLAACGGGGGTEPAAGDAAILFASDRAGVAGSFYAVSPAGGPTRPVAPGVTGVSEGVWSPDGRRIAFARQVALPVGSAIFVMDDDGGGLAQVTSGPGRAADPAWAPDGARIAYMGRSDGGSPGRQVVRIVGADAAGDRAVPNSANTSAYAPAWSPDGARLAFDSGGALVTVGADGADPHRLAARVCSGGDDVGPAWSPDGRRLAFAGCDSASGVEAGYGITVVDADGTGRVRLTTGFGDYRPVWSPDGRRIAFTSEYRDGNAEIYVMDADGRNVRNLTRHPAYDQQPSWRRAR